jgi:hypothetical protein
MHLRPPPPKIAYEARRRSAAAVNGLPSCHLTPRDLFQTILDAIATLRPLPPVDVEDQRYCRPPGCRQETCTPMDAFWVGTSASAASIDRLEPVCGPSVAQPL